MACMATMALLWAIWHGIGVLVVSHGSWGTAGLPVPAERVDTTILRTEGTPYPVSYQARRHRTGGESPEQAILPLGRDLDRSQGRHARGNGALTSISFPRTGQGRPAFISME